MIRKWDEKQNLTRMDHLKKCMNNHSCNFREDCCVYWELKSASANSRTVICPLPLTNNLLVIQKPNQPYVLPYIQIVHEQPNWITFTNEKTNYNNILFSIFSVAVIDILYMIGSNIGPHEYQYNITVQTLIQYRYVLYTLYYNYIFIQKSMELSCLT